MSTVPIKVLAALAAGGAILGAGFGIGQLYPQVDLLENNKIVKSKLSDDRRWLDSEGEAIEWSYKVEDYRNRTKDEPLLDGFQIRDGRDTETIKIQNAANMQVACEKILSLNFQEDVFKQAERWCSVKKKVDWVSKSLKDRYLLSFGEEEKDIDKWKKRLSKLLKSEEEAKKFGVVGLKKEGDEGENIRILKKRCSVIGNMDWTPLNGQLFRELCTKKKYSSIV